MTTVNFSVDETSQRSVRISVGRIERSLRNFLRECCDGSPQYQQHEQDIGDRVRSLSDKMIDNAHEGKYSCRICDLEDFEDHFGHDDECREYVCGVLRQHSERITWHSYEWEEEAYQWDNKYALKRLILKPVYYMLTWDRQSYIHKSDFMPQVFAKVGGEWQRKKYNENDTTSTEPSAIPQWILDSCREGTDEQKLLGRMIVDAADFSPETDFLNEENVLYCLVVKLLNDSADISGQPSPVMFYFGRANGGIDARWYSSNYSFAHCNLALKLVSVKEDSGNIFDFFRRIKNMREDKPQLVDRYLMLCHLKKKKFETALFVVAKFTNFETMAFAEAVCIDALKLNELENCLNLAPGEVLAHLPDRDQDRSEADDWLNKYGISSEDIVRRAQEGAAAVEDAATALSNGFNIGS